MENSREPRDVAIKVLTIIGFFATIALFVWIVILGFRALPGGFASLASIMESLNAPQAGSELTLTIAIEKTTVHSGESFGVSWTDLGRDGTYTFAPLCVDDISVRVTVGDESPVGVSCTNPLPLPSGTYSLTVAMASRADKEIEVPFTIAFESEDKTSRTAESARVTVLPLPVKEEVAEEPAEDAPVSTPSDTTAQPPATPQYTYITTTMSHVPVSDPRGHTDLAVRYVGVGEVRNENFYPVAEYEEGERGAFRFEVVNLGTKTSEEWSYTAELPGGTTYTSKDQAPLRPMERAIYTIGFEVGEEGRSTEIEIELDVDDDTRHSNDTLTWSVRVND